MNISPLPIKSQEQIEYIGEFLKTSNKKFYVIYLIAINTGINFKSLLGLRVSDVKDKSYIEAGSSSTYRKIEINKELQKLLNDYVGNKKGSEFVFHSRENHDRPMNNTYVSSFFRNLYKKLGMEGHYSLRRTFGYQHYKEHQDMSTLKYLLGQPKSIDTLRYIDWELLKGGEV